MKSKRAFAFLAAFLICAPSSAGAQVRTDIQTILENPGEFDGRRVEVEGKVESIRSKISGKGSPYTIFMLSEDGGAVSVHAPGDAPFREGDTVKVVGRFQKVRYLSQYEFKNEIDATEGVVEKAEDETKDGSGGS